MVSLLAMLRFRAASPFRLIILAALLLSAAAVPAGAATFFISTTGNDSNAGTQSQPWRTLQKAANTMSAGDIVRVQNGTYAGFQQTRSGSASSPITFLADGNNVVLNQRNNSTQDVINIEGGDGIIVDGFIIRNAPRVGIRAVTCDDVIIRNNDIQDSGLDAILTGYAVRVQIINNICGNSSSEHGIYVSNSTVGADNPIIRGNFCFGNGRSGIQLNGDCFAGGDGYIDNAIIEGNVITNNRAKGISLISARNYLVQNNVLYDQAAGAAGIHCTDEPSCGNPSSGIIVNNTLHETRIACLRITDNSTDNRIFNNIFIGQVADEVGRSDIDGPTNIIQSSPGNLFVNSGSRDYHLVSGAAAIDGGTASHSGATAPNTDHDGASRPQGSAFDIGAYEFGAGGGPTPPPAPANLSGNPTTPGCVQLSWSPSTGATGYMIHYGPTSGNYTGGQIDVGNQTSFELCSLAAGTTFFAVRAHNSANQFSGFSGEISLDVGGTTQPPLPPVGISAAETSPGCVTVTWSANGEPDLGGYEVHYGPQSVAQGQASSYANTADVGNQTTFQVCGLTGTQFFALKAYNQTSDFSGFSSEATVNVAGLDQTRPVVSNMNPASGATNVPVNANVSFTVTDAGDGVDINSLNVTIAGNAPGNVSVTGTPARYDVVCTVNNNFPSNTQINVSVSVSDLASPANTRNTNWGFTTGSAADANAPVVTGESPSDGASGVNPSGSITVDITDSGSGVDLANLEFYVNNVQVAFTWQGSAASATLVYDNAGGLTPNSTVIVRIAACDLAGNCMQYQFAFDTGSVTPPPPGQTTPGLGAITPNGYWKGDPTRPMEIRNLPANWRIVIYNTMGTEVCTHVNTAGDGTDWFWNFLNDSGEKVAGGLYLVRVVAPDGSVRQSGRFVVQ